MEGEMMSRMRRGVATFGVVLVTVLGLGSAVSASAAPPPAQPVPDCNTPNQSGGTGIVETPANNNGGGQQYLTKTGTGYSATAGGYTFTVTSVRPSTSTFTEFTDCAYSTINGNPAAPAYNENTNNTGLTYNASCSCWTVNFSEHVANQANGQPDAICDRVQVKGKDASGNLFVDYSNLVSSNSSGNTSLAGSATTCGPNTNVPEVPAAGLFVIVGGAVIGAVVYTRRRRRGSVTIVD